nr:hypothetical protein [Prevotella sp.]
MKKVSLIFMMCIFVLGMHARQQEKVNLKLVAICENKVGNGQNRHKAPNVRPLQVYYDGGFVYFQNAYVGAYVTFLDEFGNVLDEETIFASECVIPQPQLAKALQISFSDIVLIGYFNQ